MSHHRVALSYSSKPNRVLSIPWQVIIDRQTRFGPAALKEVLAQKGTPLFKEISADFKKVDVDVFWQGLGLVGTGECRFGDGWFWGTPKLPYQSLKDDLGAVLKS